MLFLGAGRGRSGFLGGFGGGQLGFLGLGLYLLLHFTAMPNELAGWRKFTEAVSNHILGYENFIMNSAIVNTKSKTDHLR